MVAILRVRGETRGALAAKSFIPRRRAHVEGILVGCSAPRPWCRATCRDGGPGAGPARPPHGSAHRRATVPARPWSQRQPQSDLSLLPL